MDLFINHLPLTLSEHIIHTLRQQEGLAEEKNGLTAAQLALIYQQKWFKLYVPKPLGGLGASLSEALQLQETLAYWDASLAWTVTLCSGATYFIGFIDPASHHDLFADPKSCWGGSGMSSGVADWDGKNFLVNGTWKYATGTYHNTAYTANCLIYEQGNPVFDENGAPLFKSFYFLPEEIEVLEDWNAMGLRATASHSFKVENLLVDSQRTFVLVPKHRTLHDPIFTLPFLNFAELTLAANYLGMFKRLIDETTLICEARTKEALPSELIQAKNHVQAVSEKFKELYAKICLEAENTPNLSQEREELVSASTHQMVQEGLALAHSVYLYSGMQGADTQSVINRVWRNLNTASQHSMFRKK